MLIKNNEYNKSLLDTSAVIALLKKEPGYEIIEDIIGSANISVVNLSELISVLTKSGLLEEEVDNITTSIVPIVIPFSEDIARLAGKLIKDTQIFGLSLGDRACIATGIIHNMTVYTTDKIWAKLGIDNIVVIR